MKTRTHRAALLALAYGLLCAPFAGCKPPRLIQDPLDYLGVGVDPNEEAEKVALQLGRAGYIVDRRIEGAGAIALEARRLRDGATAIRLITERGIALAIDAPDRRYRARRSVSLGDRPRFERRISDGLYVLSIYVEKDSQLCIATILLDGAGFARELTREEDPHPNEGCYPEVSPPHDEALGGEDEELEPAAEAGGFPIMNYGEDEPTIADDEFVIEPEHI